MCGLLYKIFGAFHYLVEQIMEETLLRTHKEQINTNSAHHLGAALQCLPSTVKEMPSPTPFGGIAWPPPPQTFQRREGQAGLIGWVPQLIERLTLTLAVKNTHFSILSLTLPKKDKKQLQAFHWLPSRRGSIRSCRRHGKVRIAAVSVKKEKPGIETLNSRTTKYLTEIQSN